MRIAPRRKWLASLVLVGVAWGLVGCSGQPQMTEETPSATADEYAHARAVAQCLQESGWGVDFDESDGSYGVKDGIPEAQAGQYEADRVACEEKFPQEQGPALEDWTAEQWSELYAREQQTAECLRNEGYDVPEIPSEQTYIDRYKNGDPWLAYAFLPVVGESEWKRLNDACPQP